LTDRALAVAVKLHYLVKFSILPVETGVNISERSSNLLAVW